jgi:hypothetical protein
LLLLGGTALAQEDLVRFGFAPEDGERWIEKMEDSRQVDYGTSDPPLVQETVQTDELVYEHAEDGGYLLTRILGPGRMSVGGEPTPNPILEASEGSRLELVLDEQGHAIRANGFRRLVRMLERTLDAEDWNRFQGTYSVALAETSEMGRWNDRLAGLVGAEVTVGEVWGYRDVFPTGVAQVEIQGTLSFAGYTELNGQRGLKVLYDFGGGSKMPSLDGLEHVIELSEPQPGHVPPTSMELHGTRVRVFIPETGQMIYENTQVEWVQPGPPGEPDRNVKMSTRYQLRPASSTD